VYPNLYELGDNFFFARFAREFTILYPPIMELVVPPLNWVTTADGQVYTHRRHNSTRQLSRVGVGGVYWA